VKGWQRRVRVVTVADREPERGRRHHGGRHTAHGRSVQEGGDDLVGVRVSARVRVRVRVRVRGRARARAKVRARARARV
jgi:hypothetical protein